MFCVEAAGDSPTRSHFYLAALSGCVPVLLDGDALSFGPGPTPWAFRRRPAALNTAPDGGTGGPHRGDDGSPPRRPYELDYESFTVRVNATLAPETLLATLAAIGPERLAALRQGLDLAARRLSYASFAVPAAAAGTGGAARTEEDDGPDAFGVLLQVR